jgi:uncharacterized protein (DUF302 family)
MALSKD